MIQRTLLVFVVYFYIVFSFAAETTLENENLKKTGEKPKIILIEPDVELAQVLASGATETRADWSEAGMENTEYWIKEYFSKNDLDFDNYSIPDGEAFNRQRQIRALHRAVGISILNNQTVPLPTKENFNWTLGKGADTLGQDGADYGLFIYLRRGYGTGGRIALSVATTVLFGAVPVVSYQFAFASLVDLETGKIVWFNDLKQTVGDLRKQEGAEKTIRALLTEFPQLNLPKVALGEKTLESVEASGGNCVSC